MWYRNTTCQWILYLTLLSCYTLYLHVVKKHHKSHDVAVVVSGGGEYLFCATVSVLDLRPPTNITGALLIRPLQPSRDRHFHMYNPPPPSCFRRQTGDS